MGKNAVIALEANFKTWAEERAGGFKDVDAWDYYCVDQFLKTYSLSDEDILSGLVGNHLDGGTDAIYFLVNRKLIQEDTDLDPKAASKVNLIIMQVKQTSGFSPVQVDKFFFFTEDLLDLGRPAAEFSKKYHPRLIEIMSVFKDKFQVIAGQIPEVAIDYYYISRCDVDPNDLAIDAAKRVEQKAKSLLTQAQTAFHFVNAEKLWTQVQLRPPKTKGLPWDDTPMETEEGWVGLVSLKDYYRFLCDEHGGRDERIFDSNVRGFQQNTKVNVGIRNTLEKPGQADFWLLNNGITILASQAVKAGFKHLEIADPQIVNGLQTSREIFDYFQGNPPSPHDKRRLMVRVIKTSDEATRDDIIRATNSQNKMPEEALRATDRIHGQIETLFKHYHLYYDRRPGQHKDEGKPIVRIVSVRALLQAMVAIVLQRPDDARARPGNYIKEDAKYVSVFGDDQFDLALYFKAFSIVRAVEEFLSGNTLVPEYGDQRNVKFYVAMCLACVLTEHPNSPPGILLKVDVSNIAGGLVEKCCKWVLEIYQKNGGDDSAAKGTGMLRDLRRRLKRRYGKTVPKMTV